VPQGVTGGHAQNLTNLIGHAPLAYMSSLGIPGLVVSKILNHAEQGVTAMYDRHSYDREKRDALSSWNRRVAKIVEAETLIEAEAAITVA
jgi:hypothetical protein